MSEREQQVLESLTPEHLQQVILQVAGTQAADNREGVMIASIVEALLQGEELGEGPESWRAYLRFKQAIKDTVSQIPGIKYVQSDE